MKKPTGYVVLLCSDGCAEEYVGTEETITDARKLALLHKRGLIVSTPKHLWDTARAARNDVRGCSAPPPHDPDPVEWLGDYAICLRGAK